MAHHPGTSVADAAALSMTREQISLRLRDVALFEGLGPDDLTAIHQISEPVLVKRGDYVFEENDQGDHFFVIIQGSVELRKASPEGFKRLAILREGQAFGEMALLNQTPRSASACAVDDCHLLAISRAAFSEMLGGDSLSVRLLKNLSKALWATSVRLVAQQAKQATEVKSGPGTLADFNRLLRVRLLPGATPRVSGYDIAASTMAPRAGSGGTTWDWFVLADGRPVIVILRTTHNDVFSAQRLAAVRLLLRSEAAEPHPTLGHMLTKVNRGLRAGWVEGLSGSVMVGLIALADGAAEWVEAGPITALIARNRGDTVTLMTPSPPVGEDAEQVYQSVVVVFARGDRIVALTDLCPDAVRVIPMLMDEGGDSDSREALTRILRRWEALPGDRADTSDISAAVIERTTVGYAG